MATGPMRHTNTAGSIRPTLTYRHRHQVEHCEGEGWRPASQPIARNRRRGWRCRARDRRSREVRPFRAQSPCPDRIVMVKAERVKLISWLRRQSGSGDRGPRHSSGAVCMGAVGAVGIHRTGRAPIGARPQFWNQSGAAHAAPNLAFIRHPMLGGFRHIVLFHIRDLLGSLRAAPFPHGIQNARLGDTAEIATRRGRQYPVISSSTACASRSAVAKTRGRRSQGSLTALTVSATQCANKAMPLSWSSSATKVQRLATSRGICLAQLACRSVQALPAGVSSIPSAGDARSILTGWTPTTWAFAPV